MRPAVHASSRKRAEESGIVDKHFGSTFHIVHHLRKCDRMQNNELAANRNHQSAIFQCIPMSAAWNLDTFPKVGQALREAAKVTETCRAAGI